MAIERFEDLQCWQEARAKETQSHGYVALDQGYISEHDFRDAYTQAETVGRLLSGMIANLEFQISARQSAGKRMRSTKNRP